MPAPDHRVLKAWPNPRAASLAFDGRPAPGLKPGRGVSRGQLLAVSRGRRTGDLRAPFSGTVAALAPGRVDLVYEEGRSGVPPEPVDLSGLSSRELAPALKSLGVDLPAPPPPGETVIVSALTPEPGLDAGPALWLDQRPALERGLALLRRLWPDREFLQILPPKFEPLKLEPPGGGVVFSRDVFPLSLPSLLRRKTLGLALPDARGVVSPQSLWALGAAARSGLPLTLAPVTIQGFHYLAPPGLKLENVLADVNLLPLPGDSVVLGGLVTGRPTARLGRGLGAADLALWLVRRQNVRGKPGPCRRCGLCRLACPMGLPMDRAASAPPGEWFLHMGAISGLLAGCAGCGACALACPAGLPLLLLARAAGASDPHGRGGPPHGSDPGDDEDGGNGPSGTGGGRTKDAGTDGRVAPRNPGNPDNPNVPRDFFPPAPGPAAGPS
ncbi:MAG: hypothetical protein LBO05_12705 [Deltaproteobacteria bacterium]|nr:hypothetical protein [Deltaproteobacteria bacterium]